MALAQLRPTEAIELEQATLEGRFFESEAVVIELQPSRTPVDLHTFLVSKREEALMALESKERIEQAAGRIAMAEGCPALFSKDALDDAKGLKADCGAVWRRQTDAIAQAIAEQFPGEQLEDPFFATDEMIHVSDGRTLYAITANREFFAYTSVIAQHEMNRGVSIATDGMWESLLTHIVTAV